MVRSKAATKQGKVLVYLFGSLGDTLVAIPALRAVKRHFCDAELVLLQNVASNNIVKASEVIPANLINRYLNYSNRTDRQGQLFSFFELWRDLRRERFDSVVYLVISERAERSVSRDKLFFRLCGVRELIGFHAFSQAELYPLNDAKHPAMTKHEALRKLDRLELDGVKTVLNEDLREPLFTFAGNEIDDANDWLASRRKRPDYRLFAIAPGCKTISNIWPLENFIDIGQRLISIQNCEIVIVGGKAEFELGEKMIEAWGEGINAAGKFSVRDSAALLSICDAYIGLDTGTTHLAASVGTPCFGIYGERNNPGHWYPLGTGHRVIFHQVRCAGCREIECPVVGHPCMTQISTDVAWKELNKFVNELRETNNETPLVVSV